MKEFGPVALGKTMSIPSCPPNSFFHFFLSLFLLRETDEVTDTENTQSGGVFGAHVYHTTPYRQQERRTSHIPDFFFSTSGKSSQSTILLSLSRLRPTPHLFVCLSTRKDMCTKCQVLYTDRQHQRCVCVFLSCINKKINEFCSDLWKASFNSNGHFVLTFSYLQ